MKLFWRERKAEQEREAREAMTKMDEMVNGVAKPKRPPWYISIRCISDKHDMTQDPANVNRFICPLCHGVTTVVVESWPTQKQTKSNP